MQCRFRILTLFTSSLEMNEALFAEPTASQPLPHSVEAEQAVLGGLMLKNDAFDSIASIISIVTFTAQTTS